MKNLYILFASLIVMSSCTGTKETKSARIEIRNENRLAEQENIIKAVESRRFIIKLDRIYASYGGFVDLRPRSNYIIIDRNKAIIRAAYIGRQWAIRPVAGINVLGEAINYELTKDIPKGKYDIRVRVNNGNNAFDVDINIGKNGICSARLTNNRLDNVRYTGYIVPLNQKRIATETNSDTI